MTLRERFEAKVDRRGPDECWPWTGSVGSHGYGQIKGPDHRRPVLAHRVAHELYIGPIPPRFQVDHVAERGCTLKTCVNPAHLEAITQRENIRRQKAAGRINWRAGQEASVREKLARTHCLRGHPYDEHGGHRLGGRGRYCNACRRERRKRGSTANSASGAINV